MKLQGLLAASVTDPWIPDFQSAHLSRSFARIGDTKGCKIFHPEPFSFSVKNLLLADFRTLLCFVSFLRGVGQFYNREGKGSSKTAFTRAC